jgi:hypothetical protein
MQRIVLVPASFWTDHGGKTVPQAVNDKILPVPEARAALRTLIYGYSQTQLLRAAARLRLADLLADGPQDLAELATRASVDPGILRRLLNGLAAIGVVATDENGYYSLTSLGDGLREDAPDSLATFAMLSGEEYYRSWLGLDLNTHDTRTPFERVFGVPVFDWLAQHPEVGDRFNRRMATRILAFAPAVATGATSQTHAASSISAAVTACSWRRFCNDGPRRGASCSICLLRRLPAKSGLRRRVFWIAWRWSAVISSAPRRYWPKAMSISCRKFCMIGMTIGAWRSCAICVER